MSIKCLIGNNFLLALRGIDFVQIRYKRKGKRGRVKVAIKIIVRSLALKLTLSPRFCLEIGTEVCEMNGNLGRMKCAFFIRCDRTH